MKHELKGMEKVFAFTFMQYWKGKRFMRATVIVAVLCFLLPALILPAVELFAGEGDAAPPPSEETGATALRQIYVVDDTGSEAVDMSFLNVLWTAGGMSPLEYRAFGQDADAALAATEADEGVSLILYLTVEDSSCVARVLLPENTVLSRHDADIYTGFVNGTLPYIWAMKMGVDPARAAQLLAYTEVAPHVGNVILPMEGQIPDADEISPQEEVREILAMILPYFNIMVLYFMVLIYGQGVANSVILEKTSKLVDTFLVTVRPGALVMGKLLAIASSGALQLLLWLAAILGGFGVGGMLMKAVNPDSQNALLMLMDQIELWDGIFSLPTLLISVLMLCGGFLLYCALAAIGGAMASKPEELSSTNALFSMVLVISFLCTLYAGGGLLGEDMASTASWLNWVPFTAILVTPGRLLIGEVSIVTALISLGLVLVASLILVLLAGKIYRMLILYKGKTLKMGDVIRMLRSDR
ncbi:MAG: ABC transporter permease [Clostridia bacterium]|nr:ABC transporter permease [Clostridia bacterium]